MGLQVLLPLSGVLIVGIGDTAASMYAIPDPCLSRELRACMAKTKYIAYVDRGCNLMAHHSPQCLFSENYQVHLIRKSVANGV